MRFRITDWKRSLDQRSNSNIIYRWDALRGLRRNLPRLNLTVWRSVRLENRQVFSILLAAYHNIWFRHTDKFQDFGTPYPCRYRRAHFWLPWGGLWGGPLCFLGGRHFQIQHRGLAEACPWWLRRVSGVNTMNMVGWCVVAKRHCLGGFRLGGSRHQQGLYGQALRDGWKYPWVGCSHWYLSTPSWICWNYSMWPLSSRVWSISLESFWSTWYILSCLHSIQNWILTWRHWQGQRLL